MNCRSCKSANLVEVLDFGKMHLPRFESGEDVPRYPLRLMLCKHCFLVQIEETVPPDLLFKEFWYESGTNESMRAVLRNVAYACDEFLPKKDGTLVDIGSNDGTLFEYVKPNTTLIGFEPSQLAHIHPRTARTIKVYHDYFHKVDGLKADVITAIAMFYDLDDPHKLLNDIVATLKDNGTFIIQQNYLPAMLKSNAFDNIVHEHVEYYSLTSLLPLLAKHGLETFRVEFNEVNGGSMRTYHCFKGQREIELSVREALKSERELGLDTLEPYNEFALRVHDLKATTLQILKEAKKKVVPVHVYGASTRGNTLLQYYGITSDLIPFAADRNPRKHGGEIRGTGIKIISEEESRKMKPKVYFVLPWYFAKEFIKREVEFLMGGGDMLFPLPFVHLVNMKTTRLVFDSKPKLLV